MKPLKISVIVPVYKVPLEYLRACLDSLVAQTMQECEFIVVSDGAPDEECSVCEEYATKDSRFKFFKREHAGVSATRNYGIDQAQGEYITFVDADDSLYSNTSLEEGHNHQLNYKSDIIYFNWFSNANEKILWAQAKESLTDEEKNFCLKQNIHINNAAFSGAPWAKLFNRIFLTKNKIRFKKKCIIGEDRVFNYEACAIAKKVSYGNMIFYKYEINEESAIHQFRPNFLPIVLNYIEELDIISKGKYSPIIAKETLAMFYLSWERCYMNSENKINFFLRMRQLIHVVNSKRFQLLIKNADTDGLSVLAKFECFLLQHKITFWIYLHGLKRLLIRS